MAKKIFIVSTAVFILGVIVLGGWWLSRRFQSNSPTKVDLQRKSSSENFTGNKKGNVSEKLNTENKKEAKGRLKKIIEGKIKGAIIYKNKLIYFNNNNFLKADLNGAGRVSVGSFPYRRIEAVKWSAKGDKVLVKDDSRFHLFNLTEGIDHELKVGIDEAIFNDKGDQLIYKYYDAKTGTGSLNVSDLSGDNWQLIDKLSLKKVNLALNPADSQKVAVFAVPDGLTLTQLFLVNLINRENQKIFEGRYGADFLWSPQGDKILVSYVQEKDKSRLVLGIMNSKGGEFQGLNFPTLVEKCVWSADNISIFCALPGKIPTQALMPNSWKKEDFYSQDTFWKINTQNGKKERILESEEITTELDASNLLLDQEERYLFFIDRRSGSLYRIELQGKEGKPEK